MAYATAVTVVERCAVSPPSRSVPPAALPLTFFDVPWLFFTPTQPLFFYNFATSTAHFTQTILPKLKDSLSLTLQHFFPLAGKLVAPAALSAEPHLEYSENDSVLLVVAEAADGGVFESLARNHRKMGRQFHGLVPELGGGASPELPLLAVQITIFPEEGICMGFTLRNVVGDWRTFNNFLREWASLCKNGGNHEDGRHVASHDRSVILDPSGLRSIFLEEFWKMKSNNNTNTNIKEAKFVENGWSSDTVRSTFLLGPKEMEQIKRWILTQSGSTQLLLSPYVITCALIWVCWMKTHWSITDHNNVHYFGFNAGGLTRLPYTVPSTYVGNCIGFGRSSAARRDLVGGNGVVYAAKAIGDTIKKLNGDMLGGAKNWISEWKELRESELHVTVTGSPKVGLYEVDFGWGRPVKFEEVSINRAGGISLTESREMIGGIEIGIALPQTKMDQFTSLFNKALNQYRFMETS